MVKKCLSAICFTVVFALFGLSVCAEDNTNPEIIYVSSAEDFASEHPYEDDTYTQWVYKGSKDTKTITVVFSEDTYTEEWYDTITIFDKDNNEIGIYSGDMLSGKAITVNGNEFKVLLQSDSWSNDYGFSVTSIMEDTGTGPIKTFALLNAERTSATLSFPTIGDFQNISLEVSLDGLNWQSASVSECVTSGECYIVADNLSVDTIYFFRLVVTGGVREGISNVVKIKTKPLYTDEEYFSIYDDGRISFNKYYGDEKHIIVPPQIDGITVTTVDTYGFYGSDIESVVLPDTVTEIGKWAFRQCPNLKEIVIPDNVTVIRAEAFKGCSSLTKITFGLNLDTIESLAFKDCPNIKQIIWNSKNASNIHSGVFSTLGVTEAGVEVSFGDTVENISLNVFGGYSSGSLSPYVTKITLGNSVKTIGYRAFANCTLVEELILPDSLESIDDSFGSMASLKELSIPRGTVINGSYPFSGLLSLEKIYINSPMKDSTLNKYIFGTATGQNSPNGFSIYFGDLVEKIPDYMIYKNPYLKSVHISDSVKAIGASAFEECVSLKEIVGGKNISTIGDSAFASCKMLTDISVFKSLENVGIKGFYLCESVETIPFSEKLVSIGESAFEGCVKIPKIVLGPELTSIGYRAFANCKMVTSVLFSSSKLDDSATGRAIFYCLGADADGTRVVIGENIKRIPQCLFNGSKDDTPSTLGLNNITSVHIGSNTEHIGDLAFYGCWKIKSISGGQNVKTIGKSVFSHCESLERLDTFTSIEEIGNYAFMYASSLKHVEFSPKLKSIGRSAFYRTGLEEIILPEGVETLEAGAFSECRSAKVIYVPSSVSYFGTDMAVFEKLDSLEKLTWNTNAVPKANFHYAQEGGYELVIGDAVAEIKGSLFSGTPVRKITLGKNVTKICDSAFYNCSALEEVIINDALRIIGQNAFGSTAINQIDLKNVSVIESQAFNNCYNLSSADLDSVIKIGANSFNRTAIERVYAPNARIIGASAFRDCSNLTSVHLKKAEYIASYAFYNCSSLISVTLSPSINTIESSAFSGCYSAENVKVYTEKLKNSSTGLRNPIYYSPNYKEIVLNNELDNYPGLVGATIYPEELKLVNSLDPNRDQALLRGETIARPGDMFAIDKDYPNENANDLSTTWISTNPEVATVEHGVVTCHTTGNTNIVALTADGKEAMLYVTVTNSVLEFVTDKSMYGVGIDGQITVYARFISSEYSADDAIWSIADNSAAEISECGHVLNADGTYTLWAEIKGKSQAITEVNVNINEVWAYKPLQVGLMPESVCEFIVVDEHKNPISGAVIEIDDIDLVTDTNGSAVIIRSLLSDKKSIDMTVSHSEYSPRHTSAKILHNVPLYIELIKVPDLPVFTDALIKVAGSTRSLTDDYTKLVYVAKESFPYDMPDGIPSSLFAYVEWGDNSDGKIELVCKTKGESYIIENNWIDFNPSADFSEGDTFMLRATAKTPEGEEVSAELELPISIIKINLGILPQIDQVFDLTHLPFLEDVEFEFEEGSKLEKLENVLDLPDLISVTDGILTITLADFEDEIKFFGTGGILNAKALDTEVIGKIQYPLLNPVNPSFSGFVEFNAEVEELFKKSYNTVAFVGYIPVPLVGSISASVGLDSRLEITGIMENPQYKGLLAPSVTLSADGGIGSDVGVIEVGSGVYVDATPRFNFEFNNSLRPEFNPQFNMDMGCYSAFKVFGAGTKTKFSIAGVEFKDGKWTGSLFDGKVSLDPDGFWNEIPMPMSADDMTLLTRSYVTEDSGFVGTSPMRLFRMAPAGKQPTLIYKDTIATAEAELSYTNGKKSLFYTYDDTENREIQNGLKLVYTTEDEYGSFAEPAIIEDDGTADSGVNTDGSFVIWEDINTVFNSDTITLNEYLSATDITAAKINEDGKIEVYALTNDSLYDGSPDIAQTSDGAVAVWVTNTAADMYRTQGNNILNCSVFDGTHWSKPYCIASGEGIGSAYVLSSQGKAYVLYNHLGVLHLYSVTDGTDRQIAKDVFCFATDSKGGKISMIYFDKSYNLWYTDNVLTKAPYMLDIDTKDAIYAKGIDLITEGDTALATWTTRQNGFDLVAGAYLADGSWTKQIILTHADKNHTNPSAVINSDKSISVSYFTQDVDVTDANDVSITNRCLYVHDITPSVNLSVTDAKFTGFENGKAGFSVTVSNTGSLNADGFEISVLCEDEEISVYEYGSPLCAGESISFDGLFTPKALNRPIEYTVKAVANNNPSDSTAVFVTGSSDIEVSQAYFTSQFDEVFLNVEITNKGTNDLGGALIQVNQNSENGKLIGTVATEPISSGESQLYRLKISGVDAGVVYVSAFAADDEKSYNNFSIAYLAQGTDGEEPDDDISTPSAPKDEPTNQNSIPISECRPDDISKLVFAIKDSQSTAATVCAVYLDANDNYISSHIESLTLSGETIELSGMSVPNNTAAIKIMIIDSKNLRPLSSGKTYDIKK